MYVTITELSKKGHISRQTIYNNLTKLDEMNLTKKAKNGKTLIDTSAIDILTKNGQNQVDKVVEVKGEEVHHGIDENSLMIIDQQKQMNMLLENFMQDMKESYTNFIEKYENSITELKDENRDLKKKNEELHEKVEKILEEKNNIDVTKDTEPQQKQGFWKRLFMK